MIFRKYKSNEMLQYFIYIFTQLQRLQDSSWNKHLIVTASTANP